MIRADPLKEHTGDPSYRPGVGMGAIEVVLSKGKATMGGMSLPRVSIAPQSAIHGTGEDVSSKGVERRELTCRWGLRPMLGESMI